MNKQIPRNLFGAAALASMLTLSLAAIGCGSDPDGGTGGGGGMSGGGTGGSGSPALGAIKGTPFATFTTDAEGWTINDYAGDVSNLGAAGSATAAMTMAVWDGTEGSPDKGSLKITAPFTDWNQNVDVHAVAFPLTMPKNVAGKKMHVRVKVGSGFVSDMYAHGGAQPYILTGDKYVFGSVWNEILPGSAWQEFTVDLTTLSPPPAGPDPSMVVMIGVQLASGAGNTMAAKPTAATLYVDSVSFE